MKLFDFKQLSWEEMEEYVRKNGVWIARRETEKNQYSLYQCKSFYVEFEFLGNDIITNIRSFSSTNRLEPYLKDIDIKEIKG